MIPYIDIDRALTHADLNGLFAELDDKTATALDNHSILYLLGESAAQTRANFAPYLGPVYLLGIAGNQPISGYWGTTQYDHGVFTAALAGAVPLTYPNAGTGTGAPAGGWTRASNRDKWLRINPLPAASFTAAGLIKSNGNSDPRMTTSLLNFSLEAHQLAYDSGSGAELHWVWETYSPSGDLDGVHAFPVALSRRLQYQQAELIFEGVGGVHFLPWAQTTRYRQYRIHNLNSVPIALRFLRQDGSLALRVDVPAYQSRCCRYAGAPGQEQWTLGGKYFQAFLGPDTDPPLYQHTRAAGNNVANPSMVMPFVNFLLAGRLFTNPLNGAQSIQFARPTVLLDPHVRAPLPMPYSALYGDVTVDATLLGDGLHHRGQAIRARTEGGVTTTSRISFNGYGAINAMAGMQARESGDDLQIAATGSAGGVTYDLVALSTNFFATPGLQRPVAEVTNWLTIDRHTPSLRALTVNEVITPVALSYNQVAAGGTLGALVTETIQRRELTFAAAADQSALKPHRHTMADAKQKHFGQQQNARSTFASSAILTAGGLTLLTTQTIPLDAPFKAANLADGVSSAVSAALAGLVVDRMELAQLDPLALYDYDGGNLIMKRAIVFTDYGWPDTDNWTYTGFFPPRLTRVYNDCPTTGPAGLPVAGPHPFWSGDNSGDPEGTNYHPAATGEDLVYIGLDGVSLDTEIAVLTPLNSANDFSNGIMGILPNRDVLYGATKNVESNPAYWPAGTGAPGEASTNRTRCLHNYLFFNVPTDGSDYRHNEGSPFAVGFYRFHRMPLIVEHFNMLAAKVNSILPGRPLNWTDHGVIQNGADQTTRYRLRPNRFGIYDWFVRNSAAWANMTALEKTQYSTRMAQQAGMRPAMQFAACAANEADAIYLAAGYAGIPIATIDDLPENFATLKGAGARSSVMRLNGLLAPNENGTLRTFFNPISGLYDGAAWDSRIAPTMLQGTATPINTEQPGAPVRFDLATISKYFWVRIADVQAYATARGYQFRHADFGAGFTLQKIELDDWILSGGTCGTDQSLQTYRYDASPGLAAPPAPPPLAAAVPFTRDSITLNTRFVEFVPADGAGAWIAGTAPLQVQEMNWADYPIANAGNIGFGIIEVENTAAFVFPTPLNQWYRQRVRTVSVSGMILRANAPEPWRRVNYGYFVPSLPSARNPIDYTTDPICRAAAIIEIGESPEPMTAAWPWFHFTADFSLANADNLKARLAAGVAVLPFTAATDAHRLQLWR